MKSLILPFCLLILGSAVFAQGVNVPASKEYFHLIDRLEIKSGKFAEGFQSGFKSYNSKNLSLWLDSIQSASLSRVDKFNHQYLLNDNWEWNQQNTKKTSRALLKYFYKTKPDFFSVDQKDFSLRVNPVLYLSAGKAEGDPENLYINTRGAEVRGTIDGKVSFYSFVSENQAYFPDYVRAFASSNRALPQEAFHKRYKNNGYDFFSARGYISFNVSKHINVQAGHDRFFIGNGYRSVILSDFSSPYSFLKVSTNIWRLEYTNLFAKLVAERSKAFAGSGDINYPSKYMSLHRLGINITKNFNFGVFEVIMAGQPDSLGGGFEIDYLNPIIFYRAIEHYMGSQHNAILGADFKWNLFKRFSVYGQLLIDEFLIDEIRNKTGWWGNKYAWQAGIKYVDVFGINQLDFQAEYNLARPYTYSHQTNYTSYSHYNQPLAHPLGANYKEWLGIVRYQPLKKWSFTGKLFLMEFGADTLNSNWGGNVLESYVTRVKRPDDRGHFVGQGVRNDVVMVDLTLSYQLKHNLFLELRQVYRDQKSPVETFNRTTTLSSFSLRWNIPSRFHDF